MPSSKAISNGRRNTQIRGFLEALRSSPAGRARIRMPRRVRPRVFRPVPQLRFLTPSGTTVSSRLLARATATGIAVEQYFVCDNLGNDLGGRVGLDDIVMSGRTILNPLVYKDPSRVQPSSVSRIGRSFTLGPLREPEPEEPPNNY